MRLSDILAASSTGGNLQDHWNTTEAASDFGALPAGDYTARILSGQLKESRSGTPGYSLTFEVLEPTEFQGRKFWHDCWLTPAAMPQTKRDLGKLGITALGQLEQPLPKYIRCRCKVILRRDDNGSESNRLKAFEVVGIDKPEPDGFAPMEQSSEPQKDNTPPTPCNEADGIVDSNIPF